MQLHPQVQAYFDRMTALLPADGPPLSEVPPSELRGFTTLIVSVLTELGAVEEPVAKVEDRMVPGPLGPIPVRVYTPAGEAPFPCLVWFHGGGWVIGDLEFVDGACRELANAAGAVVVSVDYRLAPEHPFPASVDDCYAATAHVAAAAASFGVDPARIAVGGDSAGGTLAAVVSRLARDRGGPALVYQVIAYPVAGPVGATDSYRRFGEGHILTTELMVWFVEHYLPRAEDRDDPRALLCGSGDLAGLPPAFVVLADHDVLLDEGRELGERLRAAGVPTRIETYPGVLHGFFTSSGAFDVGGQAVADVVGELRRAFA